ncbi:hypothetical protein CEE69_03700 [Rhodopirellula bahusiensis]|uniref:Uncharacterized protein n=1 Tax=Rhodopirellula bahusiensis TaxID=2014065 RepID=A0A2G1WBT1_9BACT|nr:hypothetical protein CEE69_03700 [Rhodopirellula bahusiensis]
MHSRISRPSALTCARSSIATKFFCNQLGVVIDLSELMRVEDAESQRSFSLKPESIQEPFGNNFGIKGSGRTRALR